MSTYAFNDEPGTPGGTWVLQSTRKFVYDATNLVEETDGSGNAITGYTWGPQGLMAVTDYTTTTPTVYLAMLDGQGNVVGLANASTGAVAASYTYDPYGGLLTHTGPAEAVCNVLYKQGYTDREVGLNYFKARYEMAAGIWISRDPAGIAGGSNLGVYCGNDPVNQADSSGQSPDQAPTSASSFSQGIAKRWNRISWLVQHPLTAVGLEAEGAFKFVIGNVDGALAENQVIDNNIGAHYQSGQNQWLGGYLSLGQGELNAANGAVDVGVQILNTPDQVYHAVARLSGSDSHLYVIVSPDFSSGVLVDDREVHNASKFLGGNGIFLIVTGGGNVLVSGTSNLGRAINLTNTGLSLANGSANGLNSYSDFKEGKAKTGSLEAGGAVIDFATALAGIRGLKANVPVEGSGNAYSVLVEVELEKRTVATGIRTRPEHFQPANRTLFGLMDADPAFASQIRKAVPGIDSLRGPLGGIARTSPPNWTWNHALNRPGVMQLVPRVQHVGGSKVWWLMHEYPTGRGGFAQWGQQY